MKWFDYAAPRAVDEAVKVLADVPGALMLAGGTDLLPQMRGGRRQTTLVVDIKKLPELNEVSWNDNGGLKLGAAVACHRIYNDRRLKQAFPALAEVASIIGGIPIQGRASVGGNLCNAAPSADTIPLLIALNATAEIAGPGGRRQLAVENFCLAPGQNALAAGELLVAIHIPAMAPHSGACYLRFIPRNEMDIAVAGAGVSVTLSGDTIQAARIALASVAPTPLYVAEAGAALVHKIPTPENLEKAAEIARNATKPISDMRGTAEYRRHITGVLTRRALEHAIQAARQ